jgi:hypothetical protein
MPVTSNLDIGFMLWLLYPWENPWYPLNRGWIDPIAFLAFGVEKNLLPKPGIGSSSA